MTIVDEETAILAIKQSDTKVQMKSNLDRIEDLFANRRIVFSDSFWPKLTEVIRERLFEISPEFKAKIESRG